MAEGEGFFKWVAGILAAALLALVGIIWRSKPSLELVDEHIELALAKFAKDDLESDLLRRDVVQAEMRELRAMIRGSENRYVEIGKDVREIRGMLNETAAKLARREAE